MSEPIDHLPGRATADGSESAGPADQFAALGQIAARTRRELELLEAEMVEIEMLAVQARSEATRHEQKRTSAADRLTALAKSGGDPAEIAELAGQLVTLTRRAGLMQAQVDVLEGKTKTIARFRDSTARSAAELLELAGGDLPQLTPGQAIGTDSYAAGAAPAAAGGSSGAAAPVITPPGVSRMVLSAQEDLRREIARTMHDGPAQSLTNIVMQAQIVERLLSRDPALARVEVAQLISMVQQTLDATKAFIFDVRPMVLDDLGLVPTIRRAARERGRRAQIPVDFGSFDTDRRLGMELESGLFRILDEALAAYLASRPDRVTIRLDWSDGLEARVASVRDATRAVAPAASGEEPEVPASGGRGRRGRREGTASNEPMPAALAEMIQARQAAETAAERAGSALPIATWREIQQRAGTLGIAAELSEDGRELRLAVPAGTR